MSPAHHRAEANTTRSQRIAGQPDTRLIQIDGWGSTFRDSLTGLPGPDGGLGFTTSWEPRVHAPRFWKRTPFVPYSGDAILDLEQLSPGAPTVCSMVVPSLAPSALSIRPDQLRATAG